MTKTDQYEVNFFKPLSDHAKANKKLILILATIWAVSVFGFQFLMMILNTPTPEASYNAFQSVWPQVVENDAATMEQKEVFSRSLLSVLGKNIALKEGDKELITKVLSHTLYTMQPDSGKVVFQAEPGKETVALAIHSLNLEPTGFDKILSDLLPMSLVQVEPDMLDAQYKSALPGIMEKYLVHNQNVFTNFKFIGFPFHYWYTAQFLLILFVILCLIYAIVVDKMNTKHTFVERD